MLEGFWECLCVVLLSVNSVRDPWSSFFWTEECENLQHISRTSQIAKTITKLKNRQLLINWSGSNFWVGLNLRSILKLKIDRPVSWKSLHVIKKLYYSWSKQLLIVKKNCGSEKGRFWYSQGKKRSRRVHHDGTARHGEKFAKLVLCIYRIWEQNVKFRDILKMASNCYLHYTKIFKNFMNERIIALKRNGSTF